MKNYRAPQLEMIDIEFADVITTSAGTETSIVDDLDGAWDLSAELD